MNTDVLVIGTGISGLSYAIKLSKLSPATKITLICKEDLMEGNTRYAQGGIAAVYNFEKDSFKKHIEDTYIAGDSEGDLDVIDFVVNVESTLGIWEHSRRVDDPATCNKDLVNYNNI